MWLMTSAIPVPADAEPVREQTSEERTSPLPELPADGPDYNAVQTDPTNEISGLHRRQVAPGYTPGEQYRPAFEAMAFPDYTGYTDAMQARLGTAAAREERGEFGHGTMPITDSMEPVIRDGADLGGMYFRANEKVIQQGSRTAAGLTSPLDDMDLSAVSQAQTLSSSRKAYMDSQFRAWFNGEG